ncbi:CHAT domain-containing protein [Mycena crocata]|nr:CHAT domain-containing protein [Mycena crocata]
MEQKTVDMIPDSHSESLVDQGNPDALLLQQEAVDLIPVGHPDRPSRLQELARLFSDGFDQLNDIGDLEYAPKLGQLDLTVDVNGDPEKPRRLQDLAISLSDRFEQFNDIKDFERALQMEQEAVDLTADNDPDKPKQPQNLAISLSDRFQALGDIKALEHSLQMEPKAVQLIAEEHPDRPAAFRNLAVSLSYRFEQLGDIGDLECALQMEQEAADLTPESHPDRPGLKTAQTAVDLTPAGLQNLAILLKDCVNFLGDIKDLERALQMEQEVVELTQEGNPRRPGRLQSLAASLYYRFRRLGNIKDLERVLQINREAVELTSEGHPDRPRRLINLAISLTTQFKWLGDIKDLNHAFTCYADASKIPSPRPPDSWDAALEWASTAQQFRPSDCSTAYLAAFRILPLLWMGHSISLRQHTVQRLELEDITSTATSTCIRTSKLMAAVEILEQGVATTFQQVLQLKTDVDNLPPEQADSLRRLSSKLYAGSSANLTGATNERNQLLEEIRQQPGFENFLLPKPYITLRNAAQNGPIIILNSHKKSCDALIILPSIAEPIHVSFPNVELEHLKSQQVMLRELLGRCNLRLRDSDPTRLFGRQEFFKSKSTEECFADLLSWLWEYVVEPVYQTLELHGIKDGRLWWLPTGAFTGLPLHACPRTGHFNHSYTATLGALLEAYSRKPSSNSPKFGVVGVTHTGPGRTQFLNGVETEVRRITDIVKEPHMNCLLSEQATVEAVKPLLQDCSWVHLACHGTQNLKELSKSCLSLHEGDLELETILRMPLPNAEFVFLAACQTPKGDATLGAVRVEDSARFSDTILQRFSNLKIVGESP